jgi:hypothetical protein
MNALVVNYAIDDETTCRGYAVSSVKACSCTRIFYGEIGIKRCLVFKAGASVIMGGSEQTQRGLRTTVLVRSGKFMPSLLPVTAEAVGSSPVVPDIHSKRVTLIFDETIEDLLPCRFSRAATSPDDGCDVPFASRENTKDKTAA